MTVPSPRPALSTGDTSDDTRCADFADLVARVVVERGSWRRRLEWVLDVLRDPAAADTQLLGYLSVFLKLVATGAIPSKEDGGHYRPSHHAELGLAIERTLLDEQHREQRSSVRAILRWLPSHDALFRRPEPLTRIRDIAHRNDIPHALKDEIKNTLQNKLHRSAGPEDLQTSAALLARFTAPGADFPADFVAEFRRFHAELESFFRAGSVKDDLELQLAELPEPAAGRAQELLALFPQPLESAERIDREISVISALRRELEPAFQQVDDPLAQALRLIDLKLDERAFVLVSERANRLEAGKDRATVESLAGLLAQLAEQLALSGVEAGFMRVLAVPVAPSPIESPDDLLRRARARFETARAVLGRYADHVLRGSARFAEELGRRLQMPSPMTEEFAAREIRGNLASQLSRIVDFALDLTAAGLGLAPWQAVVPGRAQGTLRSVQRLGDLGAMAQPTLVVVDRLDGDEEVPAQVRALLVGHDLPHLSHVAIRCRQSGVPMAARRLPGPPDDWLVRRLGESALLTVDADGPRLSSADAVVMANASRPLQVGRRVSVDHPVVVSLDEVQPESAGSKAWGARRLAELAAGDPSCFRAADGFVVPFGVMESCLAADAGSREAWRSLVTALDEPSQAAAVADRLTELIREVPLPEGLVHEIGLRTAAFARIAVRSSSNAEDQENAVGAGLFDSVIGARVEDLPSALRRVWASLYGRRALAAYHAGGVRMQELSMAVLLQPVVPAELSFVMYTRSPSAQSNEAYVELAAGLGESLASARSEGSPYRVHLDLDRRTHRVTSYLSYPEAVVLDHERGLRRTPVRYHELRLEHDRRWRDALMERLITAALAVERLFGSPQDVEGAVVGDDLWLLQSRPAAIAGKGGL